MDNLFNRALMILKNNQGFVAIRYRINYQQKYVLYYFGMQLHRGIQREGPLFRDVVTFGIA